MQNPAIMLVGGDDIKSDYMKPELYGRLFALMQPENALAVRMSLETGMRIGDVLALKRENINGRTIEFVAEKTNKRGRVVLSSDLAQRLKRLAGDEYIWPKRGKPDEHRTRQTVWSDVKQAAAALRAAGLLPEANVTPHSARKTFAVRDAERHGVLHTQKALQHSDLATTKLYVYSEQYLAGMTDNYVLKALIHEVKEIHNKIEEITQKLDLTAEA